MSDAFLYKAFAIECDNVENYFKVDGRKIEVTYNDEEFSTLKRPNVKKKTILELAEYFVDTSPEGIKCDDLRQNHIEILKKGKEKWDEWRILQPEVRPLLYEIDIAEEGLSVDLREFDFSNAVLSKVNFENADLSGANFHQATLAGAILRGAILTKANFCRSDLYETDFSGARLDEANLQGAQLAKANLEGADLIGCKVYGMSVWDLKLEDAKQDNIIIRYRHIKGKNRSGDSGETQITVNSLQAAQFVYLILSNKNISNIIDAMADKVILILGRFTPERKAILIALQEKLRIMGYVPVLFDFDGPESRDLTETVTLLARMARFIIADITDPASIPQELSMIVPYLPSVPVQPLLLKGSPMFAMFEFFKNFRWVMETYYYSSLDDLIANLERVIAPAEDEPK